MIRGLARILILHAVVSFRVRGQIVSQKPPESANSRKKKFPPNSPHFCHSQDDASIDASRSEGCRSIGSMPVVFYAGRGLNPRPASTDIKPTQRNHPAIPRAFQNNRIHGLSSPSAPLPLRRTPRHLRNPKNPLRMRHHHRNPPVLRTKPRPAPCRTIRIIRIRLRRLPPESAKLRKKFAANFPRFFFKIGYNPPRNQSEFFDSENQKERNPCIGK